MKKEWVIELFSGVGIGVEYCLEFDAWIIEFMFIRIMYLPEGVN